jgi:hypothetical protein
VGSVVGVVHLKRAAKHNSEALCFVRGRVDHGENINRAGLRGQANR